MACVHAALVAVAIAGAAAAAQVSNGGPAASASAAGFALALGGAGELASMSEFQWPCTDWSFAAWVRFPKLASNAHFLQFVSSAEEFSSPTSGCAPYAQAGVLSLPPSGVSLALFQYDTLVLGVGLQRLPLGRSLAATTGWQHVALTFNAAARVVTLYVNGTLRASAAAAVPACAMGVGRLFLGRQRWGETTEAMFDDVHLCNTSLAASDVGDMIRGGLPPAASTVLHWDFDDVYTFLRDGLVTDASPSGGLPGVAFSVQSSTTMTSYIPITLIRSMATSTDNRSTDISLVPSDVPVLAPRVRAGRDASMSSRVVYALNVGPSYASIQMAGLPSSSPWAPAAGTNIAYNVLRMNASSSLLAGGGGPYMSDPTTGALTLPLNLSRSVAASSQRPPYAEVQLTLDAVLQSTSSIMNYAPALLQRAVAVVSINSPPIAVDLTFETDWGVPLAIDLSSGLFPSSTFLADIDGDAVAATILSLPSRGLLYASTGRHALVPEGLPLQAGDVVPSGVVLFVPPPYAFGLSFANFSFQLTDAHGAASAGANVYIDVDQGAVVPSPGVCTDAPMVSNISVDSAQCAYVCNARVINLAENSYTIVQLPVQTYLGADAPMLRITLWPMCGSLFQVLNPSIAWHKALASAPSSSLAQYVTAVNAFTPSPYLLRPLDAGLSAGPPLREWVASVISYSSQWDNETWSVRNLIGPANVLSPTTGYATTWSVSGLREHDNVTVGFAQPLFLTSLHIFEVWNPGNIIAVTAFGPSGENMLLWHGERTYQSSFVGPRVFTPPTCSPSFPVSAVRIDLYVPTADLYAGVLPEIDAVLLRGQQYPQGDRLVAGSSSVMFVPASFVHGQDKFAYQVTDCAYSRESLDLDLPCSVVTTVTTHTPTSPLVANVWQVIHASTASVIMSSNGSVVAAVAGNISLATPLSSRPPIPVIVDTPVTPAWLGPLRMWEMVDDAGGSGVPGWPQTPTGSITTPECTLPNDPACAAYILIHYVNLNALHIDGDDGAAAHNVTLTTRTVRERGSITVQHLGSPASASCYALLTLQARPGDCGSSFDALVVSVNGAGTSSPVVSIPWLVTCTPGSQQLPLAVVTALRVLGPLAAVWTIGLAATFWWHSSHRILSAAQPYFVLLHPIGAILVVLLLPVLTETRPSVGQCVSLRFLGSVAFTLFFGVLFAKSYRVFKLLLKIHINPMLKRVSFPSKRMFVLLAGYLTLELAVDLVWTVSAPISIVSVSDPDPSITVLRCKAAYDRWFLYLWVFMKLAVMAAATYLGVMTFTVDSHHGESRVVNAGIFVSSTASLVLLLLYILFQDSDPRVAASLGAIGAVLIVCITEGIVLLPRIHQARRTSTEVDEDDSTAVGQSTEAPFARERSAGGSTSRYVGALSFRRTSASGADVAVALELPQRSGVHRLSHTSDRDAPHVFLSSAVRSWGSAGTATGFNGPAVSSLAASMASEADAGILEDDETHMPFASMFHRNADERLPVVAEDTTNESSSRPPSSRPGSADMNVMAPQPAASWHRRGVMQAADGASGRIESDAVPQVLTVQHTSSIFDSSIDATSQGGVTHGAATVPHSALASAEDSTLYEYANGAPTRGEVDMNIYE